VVPLLAVPAYFGVATGPAAHDSACHFAEEKTVVPQEEILDETPEATSDDLDQGAE
jgi:oligopeptide transport system ATP-binding protein